MKWVIYTTEQFSFFTRDYITLVYSSTHSAVEWFYSRFLRPTSFQIPTLFALFHFSEPPTTSRLSSHLSNMAAGYQITTRTGTINFNLREI